MHIGLEVDEDRYLRQTCPNCSLEFKLKADDTDLTDPLADWAARARPSADPANGTMGMG